jgi:hypothetical protein
MKQSKVRDIGHYEPVTSRPKIARQAEIFPMCDNSDKSHNTNGFCLRTPSVNGQQRPDLADFF